MNFNPIFLYKENDLNKILKKYKLYKSSMALLYTSLWDKHSVELVNEIKKHEVDVTKIPLYIMDSFNMPHSFVIFKTVTTPTLVLNNRNKVLSEDWLSKIYLTIGL